MDQPIRPVDLSAYLASPSLPERELLRLYRPSERLTILDIGSCEGEDTIRYAKRFPNGFVYAFEPLPENRRLIAENLAKYAVTNAELVPCALSDRPGEAVFHVSSGRPPDEFAGSDWNYGNKSSSLLPPSGEAPMYGWVEFKQTINVHTDTLDAFCARRRVGRIDFIHMDVQGAEKLVLEGARDTLPRVGAIWLEVSTQVLYQGQALRDEIGGFMTGCGFILAREALIGIEGDQLYVNRRFARVWPYLASNRLKSLTGRARRWAGRVKSRAAGIPNHP